jgi:hypothetical protein
MLWTLFVLQRLIQKVNRLVGNRIMPAKCTFAKCISTKSPLHSPHKCIFAHICTQHKCTFAKKNET